MIKLRRLIKKYLIENFKKIEIKENLTIDEISALNF